MPYFKRVLIPFGEYMPLAIVLPLAQQAERQGGRLRRRDGDQGLRLPDAPRGRLGVHPEGLALDLLRGHRAGAGARGDAEGGGAAGQHHLRLLVRPQPGPAPASPDRRVPRDREPPLPGPLDDHRPERGRSTRSAGPSPGSRPSPRGPPRRPSASSNDRGAYTTWVGDRPWWALCSRSSARV